jgi:ribonuclease HII
LRVLQGLGYLEINFKQGLSNDERDRAFLRSGQDQVSPAKAGAIWWIFRKDIMGWRIGVDEAGYGPNLGPLVMTAVACEVPEELDDADLWKALEGAVRRKRCAGDVRLFVEDSKEVYSAARGLADLETAVLAGLGVACQGEEEKRKYPQGLVQFGHLLDFLWAEGKAETEKEAWYTGATKLPVAAKGELLQAGMECLGKALAERGLRWGPVRCVVFCPARFNDLVERYGSKGAVLAVGLTELLRWQLGRAQGPVRVVVDKHGGRNHYSSVLQEAFSEGMVLAREEAMARSVYEVVGLDRLVRLTFMPRADGSDFCVALASMISKYVRELFMTEFNAFWLKEMPGLEPTAGYPGDALRFFEAIRGMRERLGLADRVLWRAR